MNALGFDRVGDEELRREFQVPTMGDKLLLGVQVARVWVLGRAVGKSKIRYMSMRTCDFAGPLAQVATDTYWRVVSDGA